MKIVAIGKFPGELGREKVSDSGFARSSRAHEENNHGSIRGGLRPSERFVQKHVEMVDAVFALHRIASAVISG